MNSQDSLNGLKEAISDLGAESCIKVVDWRSYHLLASIRAVLSHSGRRGLRSSFNMIIDDISPPDTLETLAGLKDEHEALFKEGDNEREMAWIMITLNEGLLGCYVKILQDNPEITKKHYNSNSVLMNDADKVVELIDELLANKKFVLSFKDYAKYRQDQGSPTPSINAPTQVLKSPTIISRRSPEPVKGLSDVLHYEDDAKLALEEFKGAAQRGSSAPVVVIDQIEREPSPSLSMMTLTSTPSTPSHKTSLSSSTCGIFSTIFNFSRTSSPVQRSSSLLAQQFRCPACSSQITADTSEQCLACSQFKCPNCFRTSNAASLIPSQILLNWDFSAYVCCNACSQTLFNPNTLLDISSILPYALSIDDKFRQAWIRHTTALKVSIEMCRPCISAPDTDAVFLNSAEYMKLEDLHVMHSQGSDPICDALELHLSRCEECRGRASKCIVCHDDTDKMVPLIDNDAHFCGNCLGGWHSECEGNHCPVCP